MSVGHQNKTECEASNTAKGWFIWGQYCWIASLEFSFIFAFSLQVTSDISISALEIRHEGNCQFYLRVEWTSAFKGFLLCVIFIIRDLKQVAMATSNKEAVDAKSWGESVTVTRQISILNKRYPNSGYGVSPSFAFAVSKT